MHSAAIERGEQGFGEVPSDFAAPGFTDPKERRRLSGPALRTFDAIAREWSMGEPERLRLLGCPGRSTYHGWMAKARRGEAVTLPLDALLRLSALLGIWKALRIMFTEEEAAGTWLRSENTGPLFGGQSPYALLTSGTQDGLMQLRRYLDAWRGGAFSAPTADEPEEMLDADDLVFA